MITSLRDAQDSDKLFILNLRNRLEVYQGFYNQGYLGKGIITWDEHVEWWYSRFNWRRFIIQTNSIDVGGINIGQLDSWCPQVGIFIEPTYWGKGVGKQALSLALSWLEERGYSAVQTTILKDNERSIRLFEGLGFKRIGDGRKGEYWYARRL